MKHTLLAIALLLVACVGAQTPAQAPVQEYGQSLTIKIWDNNTAPHSSEITLPESRTKTGAFLKNVSEAVLYLFPANPECATGQGIVLCPGGAYESLAITYEGCDMARWLASQGITTAVLKYRMPNGHPEVPREDLEQALRILTGQAEGAGEYALPVDRVGVMGCSAGGHLAATISTISEVRPAFTILLYPVISGEEGVGHRTTFNRLLGKNRTAEDTAPYWLENRVTEQTPPTLLLLSDDDALVPPVNSIRYYNALKAHGIKASMHIYPTGGHGWGIKEEFAYHAQWTAALLDWLRTLPSEK